MFGFSIQQPLVLVAIIAAVWYGFKWIGRLDRASRLHHRIVGARILAVPPAPGRLPARG